MTAYPRMTRGARPCHDPEKGFTDQLPTSMGIHNQFGKRNAPTIVNAKFNILQFWEDANRRWRTRAERPILNPIEMGMNRPTRRWSTSSRPRPSTRGVHGSLRASAELRRHGQSDRGIRAHPGRIRFSLRQVHGGRREGAHRAAKRGWSIFNGKGRCMSCHGSTRCSRCSATTVSTTSACRRTTRISWRWRARG